MTTILQSRTRLSRASGSTGGDALRSRSCSNYRPGSINAGRTKLFALVLIVSLTACATKSGTTAPATPSTALQKLATRIDDAAKAVGTLQTTVINANQAKLISDSETASILAICSKMNQAGLQASALTRQYTTLPAGTGPTLLQIINPIVAAVQNALSSGLVNITNQTVRNDVQAALTTLQAALAAVQVALG